MPCRVALPGSAAAAAASEASTRSRRRAAADRGESVRLGTAREWARAVSLGAAAAVLRRVMESVADMPVLPIEPAFQTAAVRMVAATTLAKKEEVEKEWLLLRLLVMGGEQVE